MTIAAIPNDPINQSKRIARMVYQESDPAAAARDRCMGAGLIGLLALIMVGAVAFAVFDRMTDPVATATNSGPYGSPTKNGSVN